MQESRQNHDDDAVKKAVNEYDEALERSDNHIISAIKVYNQNDKRWIVIVSSMNYRLVWIITKFLNCRYIPVLMAQAKIYWDRENYTQVEKIFRKSVEFCNEHDTWKLNVAHVLFMQVNMTQYIYVHTCIWIYI